MGERQVRFDTDFDALTGFKPFHWQRRLYRRFMSNPQQLPAALDLPTGLGKTSVMAIWLAARAHGAALPRRLVYVVDRRAVVDQATAEAERLRRNLEKTSGLKSALSLGHDDRLPISTLRGRFVDNREWLADPVLPAIVVGTVDMVGSRLLFSGFGVSRRMRPYHAGLLGADALIVLDEAHLVPPFERLLDAIASDVAGCRPAVPADRDLIPPLKLLSLSATGRDRDGEVFALRDDDIPDIKHRLEARKTLTIVQAEGALDEALAQQAWQMAESGASPVRCLVYCDSREVAERTLKAIHRLAEGDRKGGIAKTTIATELFVGARRMREREAAKEWLESHGFLAGSKGPQVPSFLVATSAGEVGVDLDADHMVCDLVPWERMVQRLGRVNRRGGGDARIVVIDQGEPRPKKPDAPTAAEKRALIAREVLSLIAALPHGEQGIDVSPAALRALKLAAETDSDLRARIRKATTPSPLRPALTRPLVEAWAMTSLDEHAGRPDIGPWLRGWDEGDEPQTSVVWRAHLPVRDGEAVASAELDGFFDAAPPHASEVLETETWRVVEWLMARAKAVAGAGEAGSTGRGMRLAIVLTPAAHTRRLADNTSPLSYGLADLLAEGVAAARLRSRLARDLAGAFLVVDARIGGLSPQGLLDGKVDAAASAADGDGIEWLKAATDGPPAVGFRISSGHAPDEVADTAKEVFVFATRRSPDGRDEELLFVETWTTEESRAASTHAQPLDEHHAWTEEAATRIAREVGLEDQYRMAIEAAARLHDEGKRAKRWQRAFNAPRGVAHAKTEGPVNLAYLDGYRHELGSLLRAGDSATFQALPADLKDLVLHLVAAHHGAARPLIGIDGCDEAPPSVLQARAREIAVRFARLQKRWGPWGLAWWEALLRAADQQASRRNEVRDDDRRGGAAHG